MGFTVNPTIEAVDLRAVLPQPKQLPGRGCNPTHQQTIGLQLYWARPCPPEQDSFSHHQSLPSRSLHKTLNLIHQRADRSSKKKYSLTAAITKTYYRKLIKMKKQKVMSQMKGQDKIPEKQLNEVEIGNLLEKEFRKMIVKMIQDLRKRMEAKIKKMQEMFTKDLEELKNKQR